MVSKLRGRHSKLRIKDGRIIKVFKPEFKYNFIKESQILISLQPFNFVPKVYSINLRNLEIEMEFVRGKFIRDILNDKDAILESLKICRKLDILGIQKEEMRNPQKHIIKSNRIVFVDFERSVFKEKPSNLTQFLNYLNSNLKIFSIEELKTLSKIYKREFNEKIFNVILRRISERL